MQNADALLEVLREFEAEFKQEKQEFKDKLHEDMTTEMKSMSAKDKGPYMHRQMDVQLNMWSSKMMVKFKFALYRILLSFVNNNEDVNGYANDACNILMNNVVTNPEDNLTIQLTGDGHLPDEDNFDMNVQPTTQDISQESFQVTSGDFLTLQPSILSWPKAKAQIRTKKLRAEKLFFPDIEQNGELFVGPYSTLSAKGQSSSSVKKPKLDASQQGIGQQQTSHTQYYAKYSNDLGKIKHPPSERSILKFSNRTAVSPDLLRDEEIDYIDLSDELADCKEENQILNLDSTQTVPVLPLVNNKPPTSARRSSKTKTPAKKPKKEAKQGTNKAKKSNEWDMNLMWQRYYGLCRAKCMVKDCDKTYNGTNITDKIEYHIKIDHQSTSEWSCAKCPLYFLKYDDLAIHYLMQHLGIYQCSYDNCGFTSDIRSNVNDHSKVHDSDEEGHMSEDSVEFVEEVQSSIQQSTDELQVRNNKDLRLQSSISSRTKDKAQIGTEKLSQDIRHSNDLVHQDELFTHHVNLAAYGQARDSPAQVQQQQVISTNEMAISLGLKCYQLDCQQTFNTEKALMDHMWMKHRIQEFPCLVKDCRQSFASSLILKDHIEKNHKDTREWRCGKCLSRFIQYGSLSFHFASKHSRKYQCAFVDCLFTSESIDNVNNHYIRVHKIASRHGGLQFNNFTSLARHEQVHQNQNATYQPHRV